MRDMLTESGIAAVVNGPPDDLDPDAYRVLVAAYDVAEGRAGAPLDFATVFAHMVETGVRDMTEEQFTAYRERVVARCTCDA